MVSQPASSLVLAFLRNILQTQTARYAPSAQLWTCSAPFTGEWRGLENARSPTKHFAQLATAAAAAHLLTIVGVQTRLVLNLSRGSCVYILSLLKRSSEARVFASSHQPLLPLVPKRANVRLCPRWRPRLRIFGVLRRKAHFPTRRRCREAKPGPARSLRGLFRQRRRCFTLLFPRQPKTHSRERGRSKKKTKKNQNRDSVTGASARPCRTKH